MGSNGLISEEEKSRVEHTSYTKTFEDMCPIFMSYGMSYRDYWYGDAYEVQFYRDSYRLKVQQQDENNWMQGMYVYEAIIDCSPILHPFSKKCAKPLQYSEKPYLYDKISDEFKTKEQKEKEEEQQREAERLKAIIHFNNWFRATQKQFQNKDNKN